MKKQKFTFLTHWEGTKDTTYVSQISLFKPSYIDNYQTFLTRNTLINWKLLQIHRENFEKNKKTLDFLIKFTFLTHREGAIDTTYVSQISLFIPSYVDNYQQNLIRNTQIQLKIPSNPLKTLEFLIKFTFLTHRELTPSIQ